MKIDLNQPFTAKDIETLLASKDDSAHRQLRVSANGIAYGDARESFKIDE